MGPDVFGEKIFSAYEVETLVRASQANCLILDPAFLSRRAGVRMRKLCESDVPNQRGGDTLQYGITWFEEGVQVCLWGISVQVEGVGFERVIKHVTPP